MPHTPVKRRMSTSPFCSPSSSVFDRWVKFLDEIGGCLCVGRHLVSTVLTNALSMSCICSAFRPYENCFVLACIQTRKSDTARLFSSFGYGL